ncbi:MGH1-like glycoside hydrolase domain-containing protein [Spirosoma montaniterrae]|uniref:Glucosidase n=1 Tax=Spirosoma montaniterrae TaxID=1178516 RepID=A0A1P9WTA2_9BACT|nr:glucosidase [Spirosoma montaniterrae]AQG78588.1 glucosidase [Spirosoma montaniterrae]
MTKPSAERLRVEEAAKKTIPLAKWGPYLSERQWGTVREDYSANGDAWNFFPHDHARSRVYRWGEDGLGGISDRRQNVCFALALWNHRDGILKERLFGLTNNEGNHGEDVKELYYYLDNTPTHSYMRMRYKYPQAPFPYGWLVHENGIRNRQEPEFEILHTGVFEEGRYFDVDVEYARKSDNDVCIRITVVNQGLDPAPLTVLPTLWCRNRWAFEPNVEKPTINRRPDAPHTGLAQLSHPKTGQYFLYYEPTDTALLTENETNMKRLYGVPNTSPFVKDAFHEAICQDDDYLLQLLQENQSGTKFAPVYALTLQPGESQSVCLRLVNELILKPFGEEFQQVFTDRVREADDFYRQLAPADTTTDRLQIMRQALAGMLWTKQYYHYDIPRWLQGDPGHLPPPPERVLGRNARWEHLNNEDVLSMPDKWEYPWYAAWDLAFHTVPLAMVDPAFAKNQLILLMREWYMNPQGQMPAYEWNFSDVNPPVHAWGALSVYKIEKAIYGNADIQFLKRAFQKLLINFTWWANRHDDEENNIFGGGFLGLDNIGVINRSHLPPGTLLEQADATAWMGMYALNLMDMALEITRYDPTFEDVATKFYEHFVLIGESLNQALWDEKDQFFYDLLHPMRGPSAKLEVRSAVGLSVLFAVSVIRREKCEPLADFLKRMSFFQRYHLELGRPMPEQLVNEQGDILLSLISRDKLEKLLQVMLDESEFLSPGGIRALSKYHEQHPYSVQINGDTYSIAYVPGDSDSGMFGGNSNWRGPVWMPINYLLIKSLKKYYQFYGDSLQVEYPTGSGNWLNLKQVSQALADRLVSIFEQDANGHRPVNGPFSPFYQRSENKELILFFEYFHGDTAQGIGASHQTGWTGAVAELINEDSWEWD